MDKPYPIWIRIGAARFVNSSRWNVDSDLLRFAFRDGITRSALLVVHFVGPMGDIASLYHVTRWHRIARPMRIRKDTAWQDFSTFDYEGFF